MKKASALLLLTLILASASVHSQSPATQLPTLAVDPYWPQLPETWIFGVGAGIATDAQDKVWVIHRAAMVTEKKVCCKPAPIRRTCSWTPVTWRRQRRGAIPC